MEKIADIIESIANEKGLEIEDVKERVIRAIINTAKKIYGENYEYDAVIDNATKTLHLYQKITVVEDGDERLAQDNEHFLSVSEAKKVDSGVEIGDELTYELSTDNLGRTAAQTLHKELEYHIQRLMEEKIFQKYQDMVGHMVFGSVTRVDSEENTFIEIDELRAVMPRKNRIKGEKFKPGDVVKAVIKSVYIDKSMGIKVELSRTSPKFLEALLKAEVPEIKDGLVLIAASARIPGERAKVALVATSPNVDPVGATVGTAILITRAMAPAIISSVKIGEDNKAVVSLVTEQKSKAIGKSGINIRLASMLTGYEIELNELGARGESKDENAKDLKALFGDL